MKRPLTILLCFFLLVTSGYVQTIQKQDFSIKIGVEEVRIDAIVLDKKGRQINNLTAADFEVYQDGKSQQVTSCTYISDFQNREKQKTSPEASKAALLLSEPKLTKDQVRRTIAFLASGREYETKLAVRKFVESQMEPGDLVMILGGAPPMGALPTSISDRNRLLSVVNSMPGRQTTVGSGVVDASRESFVFESRLRSFDLMLCTRTYEQYLAYLRALISPIRYAVRALKDMPGRKYLILMRSDIFYDGRCMPRVQEQLFNEAANEAWRAGVVIFTLDMTGLSSAQSDPFGKNYLPFSKKTGGITVENSNFFFSGIKPVQEAIRGYYLLSYIPPRNTFINDRTENYRRIRVKVKRSGAEVHSRDGFLGSSAPPEFGAAPQGNSLRQAVFSPLLYDDLKLSLSSGYAHAEASGYFLRSWMHLDGKDLTFTEKNRDGEHLLALELLAVTSDANGRIQDSKGFRYDFFLSDADVALIKRDGIDLKTYLPVQNPGYYYVSTAIKDRTSGRIGSGYQFLNIPDLRRQSLSLSSIFALYNKQDELLLKSGNIVEDSDSYNAMRKWRALSKSPASRTYKPGESFDYMSIVYNAEKDAKASSLVLNSTLFKDGQVYRQTTEDVSFQAAENPGRLPIVKGLVLEEEGEYLLQLTVTNKHGSAAQAMDFKIRKEQ